MRRGGMRERVKRFEFLDRIAFDARANAMADDGEEIDEDLRAEEVVDFILRRGVTPHQAFHGGRLVRREMVDVQIGECLETLRHEVDEALERGPFFATIGGPITDIPLIAVVFEIEISEQKLEPSFARERIPFEIEKDISRRRFGKPRQAKTGDRRQLLVHHHAARSALDLNSCLLADLFVASGGPTVRSPLKRNRHRSERSRAGDPMPVQLSDLRFADSRDQRQMVVPPSPGVAMTAPPANLAMLDRFGIGRAGAIRNGPFQAGPHMPVIGRIVRDAVRFRRKTCARGQHALANRESTTPIWLRTRSFVTRIRIHTMDRIADRRTLSQKTIDELRAEEKDWEANEVAAFLKKQAEQKSDFFTLGDFPVKRTYTAADLADTPIEDIGLPGRYPFTRGPYPTMYRSRTWTMRQIAGFGTGEDTNKRFKYLIAQGQTGIFDRLRYADPYGL
jgi:Methylmalonyl-CoA mutase